MKPLTRRLLVTTTAGTLGLVALVALAGPAFLKERLPALIIDQVNRRVDATVRLGRAEVSLIRDFPSATLALTDVHIDGKGPFEGVELFGAQELSLAVNLKGALTGESVVITGLRLKNAQVHLVTDAEGRSNTELLPPEEGAPATAPAEPSPLPELWLRELSLEGVDILVEDQQADDRYEVQGLSVGGDVGVRGGEVTVQNALKTTALSLRQGGVKLLKNGRLEADLDLRFAPDTAVLTFAPTRIRLNALDLQLQGSVRPQDDGTALDLQLSTAQATFKSLLSLVPSAYTPDFGGVDADGSLALSGLIQGLLPNEGDSLPALKLQLDVAQGRFRYPDLPVGIEDIHLSVLVDHPGGPPDALRVEIPRWSLSVDGSPLAGSLSLRHPTTDPDISLKAEGKLDLGRLMAALPSDGTRTTGKLRVDVDLAGRLSDFSAVNTDKVRAKGSLLVEDAVYTDPELPLPISIDRLDVGLDPRKLDLATLRVRFGSSDIRASGAVDNALGYALNDEVLRGSFVVESNAIDVRPFEGPAEPEGAQASAAPSGESSIVAIPDGYDLDLQMKLNRVQTNDYDLRNVRGGVAVKDQSLHFDKVQAETWGGKVGIDGRYTAPTDRYADVDMTIAVSSLSVSETLASVVTLQRMLPLLKGAPGRLDSDLTFKTRLLQDLTPDPITLAAAGIFNATQIDLSPVFLKDVADFVHNPALGRMVLSGKPFRFDVDSGRLKLKEVPVTVGPAEGRLYGSTGVADGSLDLKLDLDVPTAAIKGGGALARVTTAVKTVGLKVQVGGSWSKPKVSVAVSDSTKDQAMDIVNEVVDEKIDEGMAIARQQADALLAEAAELGKQLISAAEVAGDKLRDAAKKQAARLKKEAKGNALKELAAKEAGDRLVKEADKKADQLVKEARKKSDAALAEARKKSDKLLADAEAKARDR